MRSRYCSAALTLVIATVWLASPAHAVVPVVFGSSWDGASQSLQHIVDNAYGPGAINIETDYIGHGAGDIDPWFWVDNTFTAFLVREVAGNATRNVLGWYEETGVKPVIDGVQDGVLFDGPASAGTSTVFSFSHPMTHFGFYLDPNGPFSAPFAPQPEVFFTNRLWNDRGADGSGAVHAPFDGDVQALVYDISRIVGVANTWLVCFEDIDSGPNPSKCCLTTDNDFNDLVFEVHAFGATPVAPMTFGELKMLYR